LIFFFQAEDGIRDFHVTGVQTCAFRSHLSRRSCCMHLRKTFLALALPCVLAACATEGGFNTEQALAVGAGLAQAALLDKGSVQRSEERRVGKERCNGRTVSRQEKQ